MNDPTIEASRRAILAAVLVFLVGATAATATITFRQLDDDVFTVSHKVKILGSRGQAMKLVHKKAASVCIAAGFSYFKIFNQESEGARSGSVANATLQAQYYFEDGEGRLDCKMSSDPQYIAEAKKKLDKRGYVPMERPSASVEDESSESSPQAGSCTVEQITTMVKVGLSAEQIKAACPGSS